MPNESTADIIKTVTKKESNLVIRPFTASDTDVVILIWGQCGLIKPWNNPHLDIVRKLSFQPDLFLVGELYGEVIATAMFGYDGHRGWLNYFAVTPKFQKLGYGSQLMAFGEMKLIEKGCPKLNLQIRADNSTAAIFYKTVGYTQDTVISLGKRLIKDEALDKPIDKTINKPINNAQQKN